MSLNEKWRNNVGDGGPIAERDETLCDCADDLESACTPRKPEPEWFEKWDSWWIRVTGGKYGGTVDIVSVVSVYQLHKDSDPWVERDGWCITVDGYFFNNNSIYVDDIECVPVDREGFPAPVGWHVVGG